MAGECGFYLTLNKKCMHVCVGVHGVSRGTKVSLKYLKTANIDFLRKTIFKEKLQKLGLKNKIFFA